MAEFQRQGWFLNFQTRNGRRWYIWAPKSEILTSFWALWVQRFWALSLRRRHWLAKSQVLSSGSKREKSKIFKIFRFSYDWVNDRREKSLIFPMRSHRTTRRGRIVTGSRKERKLKRREISPVSGISLLFLFSFSSLMPIYLKAGTILISVKTITPHSTKKREWGIVVFWPFLINLTFVYVGFFLR